MILVFKKILLWSSFLMIAPYALQAQNWEFGISGGASGYMGDVNPHHVFKYNDWSAGAMIKYNLNPTWGIKLAYAHANARGDDAKSSNAWQQSRNIRFHTPLNELALLMEFNFFKFEPARYRHAYTPYVFGGIGAASFMPKGEFEGETYSLPDFYTEINPLASTEEAYQTNTLVAPVGLGFKYSLNGIWSVGLELGYRLAFTDYLDDVSGVYAGTKAGRIAEHFRDPSVDKIGIPGTQRGDGRQYDSYMTAQVVFTYTLFRSGCPVW